MLPPPPPPLSRLEELVLDNVPSDPATPSFEEQCARVRRWLRAEVDTRLRATVPKTPMVERRCSECGERFEVSERRARDLTTCDECRNPLKLAPTAEELAWAASQPPEVQARVAAFLSQFSPAPF